MLKQILFSTVFTKTAVVARIEAFKTNDIFLL